MLMLWFKWTVSCVLWLQCYIPGVPKKSVYMLIYLLVNGHFSGTTTTCISKVLKTSLLLYWNDKNLFNLIEFIYWFAMERHLLDTKTRIALYWRNNHKLKSSTANMCTKTSDSKDRPQYNLRFATNLVIPKEICQGQRDKIRAFLKKQVASHFYVWFLFLSRWQGW